VRLLVTVAHPDDEAFGCGSVLAHAADRGVETFVVCATRGERGQPAPARPIAGDLGAVREAELRAACGGLGVRAVHVLDWCDSDVGGEPAPGSLAAADPADVEAAIEAVVEAVRPHVVVTLDASDGHRDHAVVRDATLAVVARSGRWPVRTYLWCLPRSLMTRFVGVASLGTPDEEITTVVDVAHLVDRRWAAIRAHASQVPPYDAMDPVLQQAFLVTDHLRRVVPAWTGGPMETDWIPRPDEIAAGAGG
jgi:N-acetyl-1-D-myo-inositol-2-amino-2-deoxy-alpha-D-glucopyranoside deacetylase